MGKDVSPVIREKNPSFLARIISVMLVFCIIFGYGLQARAEPLQRLKLSFQKDGQFVLSDEVSGDVWYSCPRGVQENDAISGAAKTEMQSLLIVEYVGENNQISRVNSWVGSVRKGGLSEQEIPGGMKYTFRFPMKTGELVVPLCVTLRDGYLLAEIPTSEIQDFDGARILNITLLPYFCAGSQSDTGYLFVPDGSGALIHLNNGKGRLKQYNEPVYGRDPLLTVTYERPIKQTIHLPVFGIKTNGTALTAIIERGDFSASIRANVTGSVASPFYNQVFCNFTYRCADTMTLAEATFTPREVFVTASQTNTTNNYAVRYYPLINESADYAGMADIYRGYLQEEKGLRKQTMTGEPSFLVELIGGIKKESNFLGFPIKRYVPLTTYSEALELVQDLQAAGVDSLGLKYTGWAKNGVNTAVDTAIRYEKRLGGRAEFEQLQTYLAENRIAYYPEIQLQKVYQNGNGFRGREDSSHTLTNLPAMGYPLSPDTFRKNMKREPWYLLSPRLFPRAVQQFLNHPQRPTSMSIGNLGTLVYGDFHSEGGMYREEAGCTLTGLIDELHEKSSSILANDCNAYALPYVDTISCAPLYSSRFDIADEEIPFYQMVVSGLVNYHSSPLNLSGDPVVAFLKAVSTGASPMYQWIARDPSLLKASELQEVYAAGYAQWKDEAVGQYRTLRDRLSGVKDFRITDFRYVEELVSLTTLADGTHILVNFSTVSATYKGINIPARDYVVTKGVGR